METIWDWITVIAFAGLATLLLERSMEDEPSDKLWQYFPPAISCAIVNYLGNDGQNLIAAVIFGGVIVYTILVLKIRLPNF
ncbi:MAG: XrtV sorting system accessory protein [Parasphingorhabdus sp.]|uniref:XrtV sorting system accessory protein n=1 Tax=Parasphingorhabdus sp. TaxID=2709688 RepID=UPI003001F3C5